MRGSVNLLVPRADIDRFVKTVYCGQLAMDDVETPTRKKRASDPGVLVVIPCSAAKRRLPSRPIAAIERYDGPFYKVIRKAERERRLSPTVRIVIVSAKYGLIPGAAKIRFYDQRLNAEAAELRGPKVRSTLRRLLRTGDFRRVYVNLGRDYAAVIRGMPELRNAVWAEGSIGKRAALLKKWIEQMNKSTNTQRGIWC